MLAGVAKCGGVCSPSQELALFVVCVWLCVCVFLFLFVCFNFHSCLEERMNHPAFL